MHVASPGHVADFNGNFVRAIIQPNERSNA